MAGANFPKNSSNNIRPSPSSASSSHRKSRWESGNNNNNAPHKPSPNQPQQQKPIPGPSPSGAPLPLPDPLPPPPPPPPYGFHMLDRRTIVMADGNVRSYFALPPDYNNPPARFLPGQQLGLDRDFRDPRDLDSTNHNNNNKRRFVDEREERGEFSRQRQQLLQYGNAGSSGGGYNGEEMRGGKYLRGDRGGRSKYNEVDQAALRRVFLHLLKVVYEDENFKRSFVADGKQGPLHCVVCASRASKFPDMHSLIMHTYNPDSANFLVDHLGLHKVLCIFMGWNYLMPPDNSKAYQMLSADEAAANQDDLIMWPPVVIIHNTMTGRGREGRMEGLGNKAMDHKLRDLGFSAGKAKSTYGTDGGHLGITLVKYAGDQSGLNEAMRLANFFERDNRGRRSWSIMQNLVSTKSEENNPNLVRLDKNTGKKERILYGYLGTIADLEKLDSETRKRVVIESKREYKSFK